MNKRLILAFGVFAFVATGAFAQITFGLTGVQYYQEDANGDLPGLGEAWDDFKDGTGVYGGGFVELILDDMGIGLSFNQQTYDDPEYSAATMWNYDVNVYAAYHLFGGRAFLDPFLQAGLGVIAYDFKDRDAAKAAGYIDLLSEDPLYGSAYFDFGLGLGVNLDHVGVFFKAMWNVQSDEPLYSDTLGIPIDGWPVLPFKWVFGGKVLL